MRKAKPLGNPFIGGDAGASASLTGVLDPTQPPYRAAGRIYFLRGRYEGYCSGTAINSASRQLVLTAAHCIYDLLPHHRAPTVSRYLEFEPAFSNGGAPFGRFVARAVYLPSPWRRALNLNFDVAAVLTHPNAIGLKVADAVGGGEAIAINEGRRQLYQVLGYPGFNQQQMEQCTVPLAGTDRRTFRLPGPPTMSVRCATGRGASGGPWLVSNGTAVAGLTSYGLPRHPGYTFSPYFGSQNVGSLVAGL
jgi:V8-like Glu-specific endopeptidase